MVANSFPRTRAFLQHVLHTRDRLIAALERDLENLPNAYENGGQIGHESFRIARPALESADKLQRDAMRESNNAGEAAIWHGPLRALLESFRGLVNEALDKAGEEHLDFGNEAIWRFNEAASECIRLLPDMVPGNAEPAPEVLPAPTLAASTPKRVPGQPATFVVDDTLGRRHLVIPANQPVWVGNPIPKVLDIEALSRTRLREGQNPVWFLGLWKDFREERDPASSVSFAEFCQTRYPGKIETSDAEPARPDAAKDGGQINDDILRRLGKAKLKELTTPLTECNVEVHPEEKALREWLAGDKVKGKFGPWWHQRAANAENWQLPVPMEFSILADLFDRVFPGTFNTFNIASTKPHVTETELFAYLERKHDMCRDGAENLSLLDLIEVLRADVSEVACTVDTPVAEPAHATDFRSVRWGGKPYDFTATQAACVKVLWEHWKQGTPTVGEQTILEVADSAGSRLRDIFDKGKHPAWGTFIVTAGKGAYRLAEANNT